jgi:hypothetical protein
MNRIPFTLVAGVLTSVALLPIIAAALLARGIALAISSLARAMEPAYVPWPDLLTYDPVLGWKPRPNLDTHYYAKNDDVFHLVTDSEGWAGRCSVEEADMVAIGDSFTFGYGIDSDHAFFALNPSLRVKPVGAPGYSMVHGIRLIEQLGSRLRGKHILWMVYLENDLQDNLAPNMRHYRQPFLRPSADRTDWITADEHISPEPWTASKTTPRRDMLAAFCVPGPIADRAYSACDWLLHRAHGLCSDLGAELAVISVPHRSLLTKSGCARVAANSPQPDAFDPSLPDQRLSAICEKLRIPFFAGRELFQYRHYKELEGIHWNRRGHRRMAELLLRIPRSTSEALQSHAETGLTVDAPART